MDVFIDAADHEDLLVVPDWLASIELLGFFQRAIHPVNLSILGVKQEAVRDPTIVSAKDHDLRVI